MSMIEYKIPVKKIIIAFETAVEKFGPVVMFEFFANFVIIGFMRDGEKGVSHLCTHCAMVGGVIALIVHVARW